MIPVRLVPLLLFALLLSAGSSQAVILSGSDGTQNTTAPTGQYANPYWNNVGMLNGASAIYLGNDWVLGAGHVGAGTVVFDGTSFTPVAGSTVQLTNTDSSAADLILFQLTSTPDLPQITLTATTPGSSDTLEMIGYGGGTRNTSLTYYNVSGSTWNTTGNQFMANFAGYGYQSAATTERWGLNTESRGVEFESDSIDNVDAFRTTFSSSLNSAQAAVGDSGGAVFDDTSSGMVLAGVMLAIGGYDGQPSNTAVYGTGSNSGSGDETLVADIASYSAQIDNITGVPEPLSAALLPAGALIFALGVSRRKEGKSTAQGGKNSVDGERWSC